MSSCRRFLALVALPVLVAVALLLAACQPPAAESDYEPVFGNRAPESSREFIFGVHPLHNPERLNQLFSPLVDYLTEQIPGSRFRLEASRNYEAFDEKLRNRHFDFALPNPYQTIMALAHGYHVFGKMSGDEDFRGIILLRRDSPIQRVTDLKGKAVSFPAATALAAAMMPQYFLQTHGLNVGKDIEIRYVGSQESSIMNVYLGNVAAGVTWPPPWRAFAREHPEVEAALRVMWQTEPLVNNSLMARDDIDSALVGQVGHVLFSLHEHDLGRGWLERMALGSFEPASDATYRPVQDFLGRFSKTVRPLELPQPPSDGHAVR